MNIFVWLNKLLKIIIKQSDMKIPLFSLNVITANICRKFYLFVLKLISYQDRKLISSFKLLPFIVYIISQDLDFYLLFALGLLWVSNVPLEMMWLVELLIFIEYSKLSVFTFKFHKMCTLYMTEYGNLPLGILQMYVLLLHTL